MLYHSPHEGKSRTSAAILLCGIMELSVDIIVNIVHCVHLGQERSKSFREFAKFFSCQRFYFKDKCFRGHSRITVLQDHHFDCILTAVLFNRDFFAEELAIT